jgi:hypothetical protein
MQAIIFQKNKLERKIDTLLLKNVIQKNGLFSPSIVKECVHHFQVILKFYLLGKLENDYNS